MTTERLLVCPRCDAKEVIPIVYGLPGPELMEDAEAGRVALGGCLVDASNPNWRCRACGWLGPTTKDGSTERGGER